MTLGFLLFFFRYISVYNSPLNTCCRSHSCEITPMEFSRFRRRHHELCKINFVSQMRYSMNLLMLIFTLLCGRSAVVSVEFNNSVRKYECEVLLSSLHAVDSRPACSMGSGESNFISVSGKYKWLLIVRGSYRGLLPTVASWAVRSTYTRNSSWVSYRNGYLRLVPRQINGFLTMCFL